MLGENVRREIRSYLTWTGKTVKDLAHEAGVDYRTLTKFLRGDSVRFEIVDKVYTHINRALSSSSPFHGEEYVSITVYEELRAGEGAEPSGEVVGEITLPARYASPGVYALLVRGSSMEPTIMDGSIVGVNVKEKFLRHEKIYAFYIKHKGSVVKRAILLDGGKVLLKSDNERYPDFVFSEEDLEELYIIGRVVWSFQTYS